MTTVGQWERFECAVENRAAYEDPYADVTLTVRYGRPDGAEIEFWGFYDGGTTWRLRFMPDQLGTWTYAAAFTDGSPGIRGTFECVPSEVPGMLAADEANPIWFGFQGGAHILIRSLHAGDRFFAANFPDEQRSAFLDWAKAQGYNTLSIASHYLRRDEPGRGAGWETPALWPLDAREYQRAERILDDLAARRLMVYPFAGFFGRAACRPTTPQDEELYVRTVLARWGAYWNILLNVAGPEPLLRNNPTMSEAEVNRLGTLIRELDPYGHPLSVHNRTLPRADPAAGDEFRGQSWLDYTIVQGPKTVDLSELYRGLRANQSPEHPLYAQETLWSGNQHGHPDYSDDELRKNAYVILFSGAALNFADNGGPHKKEIGNSSSGFSGTLDLADRRQWRHDILKQVWDFFESVPWYTMRPYPELVSRGYCLSNGEDRCLIYLPRGGVVEVALKDTPGEATWIHAQDTEDRRPATQDRSGAFCAGCERCTHCARWVAPLDGEDWLLYLS
jgi:hypothetical protein